MKFIPLLLIVGFLTFVLVALTGQTSQKRLELNLQRQGFEIGGCARSKYTKREIKIIGIENMEWVYVEMDDGTTINRPLYELEVCP